jgi:hypothetical protein
MSGKKLLAIRLDPRCLPPAIPSKALQDLLDELEASRPSRKRAWEILQEIRWVLKDAAGMELPPPARKTIDLEGRVVKGQRYPSYQPHGRPRRRFRRFAPLTGRSNSLSLYLSQAGALPVQSQRKPASKQG